MEPASIDQLDQLAYDGCDGIGLSTQLTIIGFDVAGYDRVLRRNTTPGAYLQREIDPPVALPLPVQAQFDPAPYLVRVGGFRRGNLMSPDHAGQLFREHGIAWNDGVGNGLYESLLINRKYGLRATTEAPAHDFEPPFLDNERSVFMEEYPHRIQKMADRLKELEPIYGAPLTRGGGMCILFCRQSPMVMFAAAYQRNPRAVEKELEQAIGQPLPPIQPHTPVERLAQTRFWEHIRARHSSLLEFQAATIRKVFGAGMKIASNDHELPPIEYEAYGRIYDYPSVATRPLLLEDDILLRYYTAYFTQLFHDLTGKPPMVSIRVTLSAAGCRYVPGANLIRTWYDQSVRHGASSYYLWQRDYPQDAVNPSGYDGPMLGNPDPATLPKVRWEATLAALGILATHRRFLPPPAEVAILVPYHAALVQRDEWKQIYALFSACSEARLHTRFVSDRQLERSGVPSGVRVLLAPALEFISPAMRAALETFIRSGGGLLVKNSAVWDETGNPVSPLAGAIPFDGFPDGYFKTLPDLSICAEALSSKLRHWQPDPQSWVFDLSCANLPPSIISALRKSDPSIRFETFMYEHGSNWIYPYLVK